MSLRPQTNVIVIGVDYGRREYPAPHRHHRAQRQDWRPQRAIPQRAIPDPGLIERLRRVGREALERAKPEIEAALAQAKAQLSWAA
jgi:hypothetical protein